MSDASATQFTALIRSTRNGLWRQRLARWVWYACAVSAVILLALSLVHILLVPVPGRLWLPCVLVLPLLAAGWVLLWRRPSSFEAVSALDRQGAQEDLLVSAWEAQAMPFATRPAGAGVVMQRAYTASRGLQPMRIVISSRQERLRTTTCVMMIVALFLLQLPPPQPRVLTLGDATGGALVGSDGRQRPLSTTNPLPGEPSLAATTPEARTNPGMSDSEPMEGQTSPEQPGQIGQEVAPPESLADSAGESAGHSPPTDWEQGDTEAGSSDGAAVAAHEDPINGDTLPNRFEELERDSAISQQRTIAGAGTHGFGASPAARDVPAWTPQGSASATPLPVPYTNRFSLSQRLQVRAYFDRLEEMP